MCALVINLLIYFLSIAGMKRVGKIFLLKGWFRILQLEEQSFFAADVDFKEAFGLASSWLVLPSWESDGLTSRGSQVRPTTPPPSFWDGSSAG